MIFLTKLKQMRIPKIITVIMVITLVCSIQIPSLNLLNSQASNPPKLPPTLTDYEILELDWHQIPDLVSQNKTFEFEYEEFSFELELKYRSILQPDFSIYVVEENGTVIEKSALHIFTFTGSVVGIPKSIVTLTLGEKWFGGTITSNSINLQIMSLSGFTGKEEDLPYCVIFDTNDFDYTQLPNYGLPLKVINESQPQEDMSTKKMNHNGKLVGNGETLQCRVVLAASPTFIVLNPLDWVEKMVSILNTAADTYQSQLGVSLTCAAAIGFSSGLLNPQVVPLFEELRTKMDSTLFIDRRTIPRDLVYLFVGHLIFLGAESIGGAAWENNQLNTDKAYSVGYHPLGEDIFGGTILFAHETGHLFGGIHDKHDSYLWFGFLKFTIMYPEYFPHLQCPLFSDGRNDPYKDNVTPMREYAESRLVGWTHKTIPEGKGVNFKVVCTGPIPGGAAFHLDTIGYSDYKYHFLAYISDRTYIVGCNGEITVNGYFRQDDIFYGSLIQSYRKSNIYILTDDSSTIIKTEQILDHSDGTTWHWKEKTISGLTPGQAIRVSVGRRDAWIYDWQLVVEWSYFSVISEWNAETTPTGRFVHISSAYSSIAGDGYHIDTIGDSDYKYHFYGVYHLTYTTDRWDGIYVRGYFRQDDTFPDYLQPDLRRVFIYLLNLNWEIEYYHEILNWEDGTDWHSRTHTFEDLPIGTYRVAIGRRDAWTYDWQLTVEWADVIISLV